MAKTEAFWDYREWISVKKMEQDTGSRYRSLNEVMPKCVFAALIGSSGLCIGYGLDNLYINLVFICIISFLQ